MMPPIATFETQSISPNTFRVGDVNNDGIPDLIFSSSASGIAVLLGQTDGTFEPTDTSPIAFSGILRSMALGDMTGNGNLDVVILDNANVLVMEGLGNGGFSEPQFLAVSQEVGSRIELVDLTDNGHLDILTYRTWGAGVGVLLNNGSGQIQAAPGSPFPTAGSVAHLALGDINSSGNLDIVIVSQTAADNVTLLLGDGQGGFALHHQSPLNGGDRPTRVRLADINNNGRLDLVVSRRFPPQWGFTAFINHPEDGFLIAPGSPYSAGANVNDVAVADFTDNGMMDVVAVLTSGQGRFWEGVGNGTFNDQGLIAVGRPSGGTSQAQAKARDLNANSQPELLVLQGNAFSINLADSNDLFVPTDQSPVLLSATSTAIRHLAEQDGSNGALAVLHEDEDSIVIFRNDGEGSFPLPDKSRLSTGRWPTGMHFADLDGDGHMDLLVSHATGAWTGGANAVWMYQGNGAGEFELHPNSPVLFGSAASLTALDFTGNGHRDLLYLNSGQLRLKEGQGDFTFSPYEALPIEVNDWLALFKLADLSGNGGVDLLVVDGESRLVIYLGAGAGDFENHYTLDIDTTSFPPTADGLQLSDLNGNGALDLVVGTSWDARVHVFLNDGTGQLLPAPTPHFSGGGPIGQVRLADVNQNGHQEIILRSIEGDPELRLFGSVEFQVG